MFELLVEKECHPCFEGCWMASNARCSLTGMHMSLTQYSSYETASALIRLW